MEGLKTHDVDRIASTFSERIRFVAAARVMRRSEILAFLRALYQGFPDWRYEHEPPRHLHGNTYAVEWKQGGTHTGRLAFPGFPAIDPTGRKVDIPAHDFFYRVDSEGLLEIRPDPVPGGAPRGIFEQIGVELPPL